MKTPNKTPIEDLMNSALEHYKEASEAIMHWNSDIPRAIKQYYQLQDSNEPYGYLVNGEFHKADRIPDTRDLPSNIDVMPLYTDSIKFKPAKDFSYDGKRIDLNHLDEAGQCDFVKNPPTPSKCYDCEITIPESSAKYVKIVDCTECGKTISSTPLE